MFLLGIIQVGSQAPKYQTGSHTGSQHPDSVATVPQQAFLKCVLNSLLIFPLIFLVLIIFSSVISLHSLSLPQALVSFQAFYCIRWQS